MSAHAPSSPAPSSEAAAVHAVAEALRRAVNASDVDGVAACWAPDGVMLPPHHEAVRGRNAIREYFARAFASRRLTFTFTDWVIDVAGDVAIERLHYTAIAKAPTGETTDDAGKGIHVCARGDDGSWRLVQDIWNSDRNPNGPVSS